MKTGGLKIAVTGATGMLGANIVAQAASAGHRVRALKRAASSTAACEGLDPEWVEGDVTDPESLKRAFAGMDVVIHTAARIAFWPGLWDPAYAANVIGTRNVAAACRAAGVDRLVHTSTISAIGICLTPEGRITEEWPFTRDRRRLVYHKTKWLAEQEIQEAVAGGLSATMINPSLIFGERDVNLNAARLFAVAAQGAPFYTAGGSSICDADEVAKAHLAAIERGRDGERYVTGGENVTNRQVVEMAGEIVGKQPPFRVRIPRPVILAAGWVGDGISRMTGKEGILSSGVAADATLYAWTDSSKAIGELGYAIPGARISMEKSYRWLKERGKLPGALSSA